MCCHNTTVIYALKDSPLGIGQVSDRKKQRKRDTLEIGQELDGCWLGVGVVVLGFLFVCSLCVGSWPFILIELSNNDYFSTAS